MGQFQQEHFDIGRPQPLHFFLDLDFGFGFGFFIASS
jgi:hypothetical protein